LKRASALLCVALFWRAAGAESAADAAHPLLALARELETQRAATRPVDTAAPATSDLRSAEHALEQARPPPGEKCARTLGAPVFADLYADLALARENRGDFDGAAQAYTGALDCTPRSTRMLGNLAWSLFKARDLVGARSMVERALAVDPRSVELARLAGDLDFIEEHWADAVTRLRYAAASEPDRVRAGYWQLMYWLAQLRAGVSLPELVDRRHTDDWPRELLLYMQDQYTEAELAHAVREGEEEYANSGRDERLCKALYYVGEAHWARGQPEVARDYFAAAVNLKMIRLDEHSLALAEIAKLQGR